MVPEVTVYTAPPEALVQLLTRFHFPRSLPLVRRLSFTKFPGGITEHARILWCSKVSPEAHLAAGHDEGDWCSQGVEAEGEVGREEGAEKRSSGYGGATEAPFAAAYLDFSRGPETELWIYSSMERRAHDSARVEPHTSGRAERGESEETGERQLADGDQEREEIACAVALLREVKRQQDVYFALGSARTRGREFPTILVGNLNEGLRETLARAGMAIFATGLYNKWVFKVDDLPDVRLPEVLGDGRRWVWDVLRRQDIPLALSRNHIQRTERTVKLLPSTALYLDDGTPVAWAFLGPDSSLSSLHCEEPYRGKGIAKAVAVKVLKDHLKDFGHGAYGWADVALDNIQSSRVCQSLNGQVKWQISWSRLNLDQSFPDV